MRIRSSRPAPGRRNGSAVIVIIALVAIVMIYLAGNVRTLHYLTREVKLVEQRQVRRLTTVRIHKTPVVAVPAAETGPAPK